MFKNLCGHGFLFCWCLLLRFLICFCVWVCDDNNFLSDLIGLFLFQSMPFSFWACFQSFAWSWLSQFVWGCNAWPIRYIVNYDSWSVSGARKGFVPANSCTVFYLFILFTFFIVQLDQVLQLCMCFSCTIVTFFLAFLVWVLFFVQFQ